MASGGIFGDISANIERIISIETISYGDYSSPRLHQIRVQPDPKQCRKPRANGVSCLPYSAPFIGIRAILKACLCALSIQLLSAPPTWPSSPHPVATPKEC